MKTTLYALLTIVILLIWYNGSFDTRCMLILFSFIAFVVIAVYHLLIKPNMKVFECDCNESDCPECLNKYKDL